MTDPGTARRVLVPRSAVRSSAGRALGWIALPWAVGFALVADTLLVAAGVPRTFRPPLMQIALLVVGLAPAIVWFFAGPLGRRGRLTWLLESPQPTLVLDKEGLTLVTGRGAPQRLLWREIAAVRILPPSVPSRVMGHGDVTLAQIPGPLVTPRIEGGRETRLVDELAAFSPNMTGLAENHLADRVTVAIVLVVLLGLGALGVIVLLTR